MVRSFRRTTSTRTSAAIDRVDNNSTDSESASLQTYNGVRVRRHRAVRRRLALRRLDVRPPDAGPLRRARELGEPARRDLHGSGLNLNQPKSDYHFCNQSGPRTPVPARVQALGHVPASLVGMQANAAFQSYPGAGAADTVEHRTDHPLRGRLQRAVHAGRAGHPEHDAGHLRPRSGAARQQRTTSGRISSTSASARSSGSATSSSPVRSMSST